MNKSTVIISVIICLSLVISCTKKVVNYPYTFIKTKTENDGANTNTMDLYAFPGEMDIENLKDFCSTKKSEFNSGTFHFIVFFDDAKNAVFPKSPFTAEYGMEEKPKTHIRAIYTYNRINGFSELKYYEKNSWDNPAKSANIY